MAKRTFGMFISKRKRVSIKGFVWIYMLILWTQFPAPCNSAENSFARTFLKLTADTKPPVLASMQNQEAELFSLWQCAMKNDPELCTEIRKLASNEGETSNSKIEQRVIAVYYSYKFHHWRPNASAIPKNASNQAVLEIIHKLTTTADQLSSAYYAWHFSVWACGAIDLSNPHYVEIRTKLASLIGWSCLNQLEQDYLESHQSASHKASWRLILPFMFRLT